MCVYIHSLAKFEHYIHYLNHQQLIVDWLVKNTFQWSYIRNSKISIMKMHLKTSSAYGSFRLGIYFLVIHHSITGTVAQYKLYGDGQHLMTILSGLGNLFFTETCATALLWSQIFHKELFNAITITSSERHVMLIAEAPNVCFKTVQAKQKQHQNSVK